MKNDLKSINFEPQTMLGLVTKAAQLRQDLVETRKKIENLGAKPESLKEVWDEITAIKKEMQNL